LTILTGSGDLLQRRSEQPFMKVKSALEVIGSPGFRQRTAPVCVDRVSDYGKEWSMRKAPLALAAAAVLGLTAVAAPSPAEAHWRGGGFFPAVAGGLIAGAVIGGLASNAYAYGPGYGYYGGYAPAYYGGYYGGGYAPAYYGGYYDNPYPVVRYRRVVRPAYAYYGGPRYYGGARYYGGPRFYRAHYRRW
jgi:hypothetical protein